MLERFNNAMFTIEFKYDGERAQVPPFPLRSYAMLRRRNWTTDCGERSTHSRVPRAVVLLQVHYCEDGTVNIYSRNSENNTSNPLVPPLLSAWHSER